MFVEPFTGPTDLPDTVRLRGLGWRYLVLVAPVVVMHLAQWIREWTGRPVPPVLRAASTGAMALALIVVDRAEAPPFLYFQF